MKPNHPAGQVPPGPDAQRPSVPVPCPAGAVPTTEAPSVPPSGHAGITLPPPTPDAQGADAGEEVVPLGTPFADEGPLPEPDGIDLLHATMLSLIDRMILVDDHLRAIDDDLIALVHHLDIVTHHIAAVKFHLEKEVLP